MKEPTALDVLIAARAKIAEPKDWGRGWRPHRKNRASCCAAEAIEETGLKEPTRIRRRAYQAIMNATGAPSIVEWNDDHNRTHTEVLAAFDLAIALERNMPRASQGRDTVVPPPKFGAVCKVLWPEKTAANLAVIAGRDERTAKRWLSGEYEPPISVLLAVVHKMFEH